MKNQASVKEERKENNHLISHGEFNLKRYSLWFIIFASIFLLSAQAETAVEFSEKTFSQGQVQRVALDNGMVLLLKENHNLPLVTLFLCIRCGSAQEGERQRYYRRRYIFSEDISSVRSGFSDQVHQSSGSADGGECPYA